MESGQWILHFLLISQGRNGLVPIGGGVCREDYLVVFTLPHVGPGDHICVVSL